MVDEDDDQNSSNTLLGTIYYLASSRADGLAIQKRKDMLANATSLVSESSHGRQLLSTLGDLKCTSVFGHRRVCTIYCMAIVKEEEHSEIRVQLCKELCRLLRLSTDLSLLNTCRKTLSSAKVPLTEIFTELSNEPSFGIPAISFLPSNTPMDWQWFLQAAVGDTSVASSLEVQLCQPVLQNISLEAWEDIVAPAIILKLKAKPDTVLDTVVGVSCCIPSNVIVQSKTVIEQLLPVLMKHLKSPKEQVREAAASIITNMINCATTTTTVSEQVDTESKAKFLSALAESLADTKALSQAYQRQMVYTALKQIGTQITKDMHIDSKLISTVLTGIATPLGKETKASTEAREQGLEALLRWIVVSKRNSESTSSKGYKDAVNYIQKPVIAKNGPDSVTVLGTMIQVLHPDLVESILLDLWTDAKFVKGLEGLVEAANKKHSASSSSSSTVPPVEGLVAVYLSLVHAATTKNKLASIFDKALTAGSLSVDKTSFVFGTSMTASVATNALVSQVLPSTIALYIKLYSSDTSGPSSGSKSTAAMVRALACGIAHPSKSGGLSATQSIQSSVQMILNYQTSSDAIVNALFEHVNVLSIEAQALDHSLNSTRQAREGSTVASIKGKCSPTGFHHGGMDTNSVRRIAYLLAGQTQTPESLAKVLILMHVGSTKRSSGKQRSAVVKYTQNILSQILSSRWEQVGTLVSAVADLIVDQAASTYSSMAAEGGAKGGGDLSAKISEAIHFGAASLITSLGMIGSSYSPDTDDPEDEDLRPNVFASQLCTKEIATRLADKTKELLTKVEAFTETDIELYKAPAGVPFKPEESSTNSNSAQKRVGGKGRMTEDEEWELQMKKELANKKSEESAAVLSAEDKKLVEQQDQERQRISDVLNSDFCRVLSAIEHLAMSDIEIGNSCLPVLSDGVLNLAVSECSAVTNVAGLKAKSLKALTTLATCVYEIQEDYAPMMALALVTCCRRKAQADPATGQETLTVVELPSPCEPAASTIFEMDEFQDELSGASFAFLFPVVRAALTGPRTTPGCEGALRVLERHTILLAGESKDPNVVPLRKEMVASVLELLKHDRAQTFSDPSPYETIVACYQTDDEEVASTGPALSTAELAALLDERGALGGKSCRIASMIALGSIASEHRKLVKVNPLIENRIWMNCFEKNESIRTEALKTWGIIHDVQLEEGATAQLPPPSAMYAIPLLPLLSNDDQSIAAASAEAYAHGMAAHPASVNRNIQKLCSSYIDNFPGVAAGDTKPKPSVIEATIAANKPAAPKKKPAGIPASLKKKTVKKTALQVAGIGQAKKTTKKKATHSALLKPKTERTLGEEELVGQFKVEGQKVAPEKDSEAKVSLRLGVLRAIAALSSANVSMDIPTLKLLTSFLMAFGIAEMNDAVKGSSRNALRDVIASNGGSDEAIAFLLPHLDKALKTGTADAEPLGSLSKDKIPHDALAADRRKEGAVVALGSVALHLKGPENASKIDATIDMLLDSLKTPSEDVQSSVADCLAKLMKKGNTQDRIESILDGLVVDCINGETSPIRRGAAYGIAACVKGSGIATLKKFGIVTRLEEACSSASSSSKEGSLFAIELLCTRLGLLFEPYVIVLLPSLLKSFSDNSDHVRKAASNAVDLIMSKLSAHGVKLVMPAVLTAFNDKSWRTKQASIHMLGSMSHLAPKQLASALPKVVPQLTIAFSDTHPKVKGSAQEALDEISTVIRNPEISSISSVLLKALTDPAGGTSKALESLIETEFLHAIDAPSLALIVPILHRGLRDRGASTKRYAALIAGNICTMINDPRDFVPYLPTLLPDLKTILLDPIPDVRSIAAKALGSLTRSLGEDTLQGLCPWLLEQLRAESLSAAERSGAAQGLTEVLIASGTSVVESVLLDDILPLKSHPEASTREGVLWVLTFAPPALGQGFTPMLDASLPALISGLSDENEQVREVAMRAGRVLIKSHGRVHVNKILPILEGGMADDDHRIRLSSLMLLGDLLSMIGGTTILKTDGDTQDDIRKAERAQAQLTLVLGRETTYRVFSSLYLARSNSVSSVRQAAIQVWKTVVSVTGRTLRQILPVLVKRVVSDLASGHPENTEMAGKCLGDIVSKLGDSVLPEIIPVLRNALYDGDNFTRRGVCVGLSEVIRCSTKDQILRFIDIVVKVVQDALCDDDEEVRQMAAASFQHLHSLVGNRAMDEVVPALMVALENSEGNEIKQQRALNGLTGILCFRSRELLPYMIPQLIQEPISTNHAKALAGIATVTGGTIYHHFTTIIPALVRDLASFSEEGGGEREEAIRECARSIFSNTESAGVNWLVGEVTSKCGSDKISLRKESCWMIEMVVTERKEVLDFYDQVPIIIRELVYRLNDENSEVLKAAHNAFKALSTHVPAEELVKHVEFMKNLIASMVSDSRRRKGGVGDGEFLLPGFNMPKGLEPLLPIYQRGILYGSPEIREASASGLGEVINLTATKFLAGPLVIKMTGPLLRIVGDRNPSNVKVAILRTLGLILVKGGPALRAFVPQFQTTFVKALSDPSRQVRVEAIGALGLLMPLSTRVDPLLKELVSGSLGKASGSAESAGIVAVQTATLQALAVVLEKGGQKTKLPDSIPSALDASKQLIAHDDENVREAAAKVMGAACDHAGDDMAAEVIRNNILPGDDEEGSIRHGKACAIRHIFCASVSKKLDSSLLSELTSLAIAYMKDDKVLTREAGCVAVGAAVARSPDPISSLRKVEPHLLEIMGNKQERMEVHQALARGLCLTLQLTEGVVDDRIAFLGTTLLNACLKLALSGTQRVQFAYNDALFLALRVAEGTDGLDKYSSIAMFENSKQMKSLYSKVLVKIKDVTIE